MDILYFFYESTVIRVPFFGDNRRLFALLESRGGGTWDNVRQEFIFTRNESTSCFNWNVLGIPCVRVEENSSFPLRIFGFWRRPWPKPDLTYLPQQAEVKHPDLIPAKAEVASKPTTVATRSSGLETKTTGLANKPEKPSAPFAFIAPPSMPEKLNGEWRL
jgi:hypothetical protein